MSVNLAYTALSLPELSRVPHPDVTHRRASLPKMSTLLGVAVLVDYITIAVGTILLCEWVESWLNSKLGSEWVIWDRSATEL